MIGRHIEVLIPLEDRKGEAKVLAAVAQGERVEQYQTRRIRKDGTPVDVSLTLSPIADRAGPIVGVATVARDLTDRQRAEARFRGLMEAATDPRPRPMGAQMQLAGRSRDGATFPAEVSLSAID